MNDELRLTFRILLLGVAIVGGAQNVHYEGILHWLGAAVSGLCVVAYCIISRK